MTSRTPLGVQPRPPQRSMSGSGLSQRPQHAQRALSQQYLPPSPVIDLTGDNLLYAAQTSAAAATVAAASSASSTAARRTGSRLKLELSSNTFDDDLSNDTDDRSSTTTSNNNNSNLIFTSNHPVESPQTMSTMNLMPQSQQHLQPPLLQQQQQQQSSNFYPQQQQQQQQPHALDGSFTPGIPDMIPFGGSFLTYPPICMPPTPDLPLPAPVPMPKRRGPFQPTPPPTQSTQSTQSTQPPLPPQTPTPRKETSTPAPAPTTKRDGRPKPYNLDPPTTAPRYCRTLPTKPTPHLLHSSSKSGSASSGFADFFPWTGDQAEDHLSESVIRQGFFDKAVLGSASDATGAKSTICPLLKHKACLSQLSMVFSNVLTQRRQSGKITRPSTFKPPPRATLTDAKREGWLKELANADVPLRKLSRTIPHGIRGRLLLDQCLNKRVPTDRAVWLAKCVGANDIRGVKRKGANGPFVTGGETGWIRDWTTYVEQFVESVMAAVGEPEWKLRVTYAIRLATHLWSEHLLDKDHYMDWLLSSIENAPQQRLPMWLLVLQIYWRDLLRFRKTGRRLVASLLSHIYTIQSNPDRDVLAPLSAKLGIFIGEVLKTSPESFVSPPTWLKYKDTLRSLLGLDGDVKNADPMVATSYRTVNIRNERLSASTSSRSQPAARQVLIRHLDSTILAPLRPDLPLQAWNVGPDKTLVVKTVLEWATSLYRPGLSKVYVATRLLKTWGSHGLDVTTSVFEFAQADPLQEAGRRRLLYHIVSELVRSGHFIVARYIQWTVLRGGLKDPAEVHPDGTPVTRLLVELPVHTMTPSLRTMRVNLLQRAQFDTEKEVREFVIATKWLRIALGMPLEENDPHGPFLLSKQLPFGAICARIKESTRALKTELGVWMRNNVVQALTQSIGGNGLQISIHTFRILRQLLEAAEDYTMLADVLKTCTCVSNIDILAACADTISLHLPTFAAIGVVRDLFDALYERLKMMGMEQGLAARPLLSALSNLADRILGTEEMAMQLAHELIAWDKSSLTDASSPISDSMMVPDQESELHDQIEKLLQNGTSMDRPTMVHLFQAVQNRITGSWYKCEESRRTYAGLLARLRLYDPIHFDTLLSHWIWQFVRSLELRPPILFLFPMLVSSGCLNLSTLLAAPDAKSGSQPQPPQKQQQQPSTWFQEVLQLVMVPQMPSPNQILTAEECYRFKIKQQMVQKSHPKEVLALLRQALIEWGNMKTTTNLDNFALPLDNPTTHEQLAELIRVLILNEPTTHRVLAAKWPYKKLETFVDTIASRLLLPGQNVSGKHGFEQVLGLANEFTTPFCQLKLSLMSHMMDDAGCQDVTEKQQTQLEMFSRAMDNAIESHSTTWLGMLPCLSPTIACFLKQKAERQFLDLMPSVRIPVSTDFQSVQMAQNLMSVISAIIRGSGASSRTTQLTGSMVDKLADLWEILSSPEISPHTKAIVISTWLPLLMSFISLHASHAPAQPQSQPPKQQQSQQQPDHHQQQQQQQQSTSASSATSNPASSNATATAASTQPSAATQASTEAARAQIEIRGRLCLGLSGILKGLDAITMAMSPPSTPAQSMLTPPPSPPPPPPILSQGILDLGLVLADGLNDEVRTQCVRALRDASTDPRLRYMFSIAPSPSEGLMLARQEKSGSSSQSQGDARKGSSSTQQQQQPDKLSVFAFRRWEILKEPTPNVGENDTSLSLTLFEAIKQI